MGIFNWWKKEKTEIPQPIESYLTIQGNYDKWLSKLKNSSLIMLVIGKRGSGKTSLGMKLLEMFHDKRSCYIMGYEKVKLPSWIKTFKELEEVKNNSVVLIDEGALSFSARDAMAASNKHLSKLMAIARHKNLTLILITQNSAMIELNVLRLADTLLLKEPSLLQSKFERKALKDIYDRIDPHFKKVAKKEEYAYVWDDDFEGMLHYSLPGFWSEGISKTYKDYK